jgi:hypothetical protein
MNNQQQTPIPWRQHSVEQTSRSQHHHQQQQARVLKNESDQKNTSTKPKSAPPLTTHDQPYFAKDKEQKSTTDTVEYPTSTSTNVTMSTKTILPSCPSNSASGDLFYRAIQDSEQIENSLQQTSEPNLSIPFQSSEPLIYPQQTWEGAPSQYFQNPSMSFILFFFSIRKILYYLLVMMENTSQTSPYQFERQYSTYMSSQYQPLPGYLPFQPGMRQFNPMELEGFNGIPPFSPYDLPLSGYPIGPMGHSIPINYEQQVSPQIPNVPMRPREFASTSSLSYDAPPFEPQKTSSSGSTNRQTLQFIPSQVLRNIPKKS